MISKEVIKKLIGHTMNINDIVVHETDRFKYVRIVVEKMRKNRLRYYEHIMRIDNSKAVRAFMKMNVKGKSTRGKFKMRSIDGI